MNDTKLNDTKFIKFYTDGACKKNGQRGASAGIGIYCRTNISGIKNTFFASAYENDPTNNRAELTAILYALEVVDNIKDDIDPSTEIIICTDSKYSYNSITKWMAGWKKRGWKKADKCDIKNKDIFMKIDEVLCDRVKYVHTYSHLKKPNETDSGFEDWYGNDVADRLANVGVLKVNDKDAEFIPNELDKKMNALL